MSEIYDKVIKKSDAIVKEFGCKIADTTDEALEILENKKKVSPQRSL